MLSRTASHAGSWYSDSKATLTEQLHHWLDQVPNQVDDVGTLPAAQARVIIAPHAGYSYSGPAAAWAYKALDLSNVKRIFLLGPSHHQYLTGCTLTQCHRYETPLGPLKIDLETVSGLHQTGKFEKMSLKSDEDEHSLEMHLPYIYFILSRSLGSLRQFPSPDDFPPLVPVLVGSTKATTERSYGALFAPYLADPSSIFIVSSDFCHWGSRFGYTYYLPSLSPLPSPQLPSSSLSPSSGVDRYSLKTRYGAPKKGDAPIHESIRRLDRMAMDAIESGSHERFLDVLRNTENTVCGRHPIGLVMSALETLNFDSHSLDYANVGGDIIDGDGNGNDDDGGGDGGGGGGGGGGKGRFKFIRYEQSSQCLKATDSSVSYASAFAVL